MLSARGVASEISTFAYGNNESAFCLELQTPRTLIPTNGRANSTVNKSTNIL
jgi:hypothetical protein